MVVYQHFALQAIGEPPILLATTVFFAIKDAIAAARKDAGLDGLFQLNSPATAERIRMTCVDEFTKQVVFVVPFCTCNSKLFNIHASSPLDGHGRVRCGQGTPSPDTKFGSAFLFCTLTDQKHITMSNEPRGCLKSEKQWVIKVARPSTYSSWADGILSRILYTHKLIIPFHVLCSLCFAPHAAK